MRDDLSPLSGAHRDGQSPSAGRPTSVGQPVWEFDVGVTTHDLLHDGILVDQWINVRVAADTWLDASRTAIQMGMCHGYATECLLRI